MWLETQNWMVFFSATGHILSSITSNKATGINIIPEKMLKLKKNKLLNISAK